MSDRKIRCEYNVVPQESVSKYLKQQRSIEEQYALWKANFDEVRRNHKKWLGRLLFGKNKK